jgi:arylsulfatase A-like enzyme
MPQKKSGEERISIQLSLNKDNMTKKSRIPAASIRVQMGSFLPLIIAICVSCSACREQLPNVMLLMADDMGWGDVAYNGHPHIQTPGLDKMAASGLVFNRFYAAAPVCSPTRGSVLTGRHPFRYGIYYANIGKLPQNEITLAEVLKTKGYATGHFGKWHLGTLTKKVKDSNRGGRIEDTSNYSPPWQHGFDVCFSTEAKVPTWDPMITPERAAGGVGQHQVWGEFYGTYYWTGEGNRVCDNLEGDDSRVIMDRVIPFIRDAARRGKPFLAVVWFHTPHSPVVAGNDYRDRYPGVEPDFQHYYACITAMDEQIGRLRKELEALNISRNTMIWFTSDNGPAAAGSGPGDDKGGRQQGETGGFRERKGSLYEGGIRVPGILVWPEKITEHRETGFPAVTTDYYPTILDLLDISLEDQPPLDGISLRHIIDSDPTCERNHPIGFQSSYKNTMMTAWSGDRYKLVSKDSLKTFELYDLLEDPFEKTDISAELPEIKAAMQAAMKEWLAALIPPGEYPHPVTNPASPLMLSGDWVPENTQDIDFFDLPKVPAEHVVVSDVRDEGGRCVNQHNYLAYHEGLFWVMWSDGPGVQRTGPAQHRDRVPGHDRAGQRVSFAYSQDGTNWSSPADLAGPPDEGFGWIARGFWIREGRLLALASRFNAPDYRGKGLQLHAFELEMNDPVHWIPLGILFDNALNNFPPKLLPTGVWMMTRRDSTGDVHVLLGGTTAFNQWESYPITEYNDSSLAAEEPYWWLLPDNSIVGLFRDNHRSGFLYRAFSTDNGRTWSKPVRTNFPDATSKFHGLRLSDGRYVLVSNPNPEKRDPLAISISEDGLVFTSMMYLVGGRHIDYPHVMEHEGYIYVAFAGAKQTVEIIKIKISDLV